MIRIKNLLDAQERTMQVRLFPQIGKLEVLNAYGIKDSLKSIGFEFNGADAWQINDKNKIIPALKALADIDHEIIYYVPDIEKALPIMQKQLGGGVKV